MQAQRGIPARRNDNVSYKYGTASALWLREERLAVERASVQLNEAAAVQVIPSRLELRAHRCRPREGGMPLSLRHIQCTECRV